VTTTVLGNGVTATAYALFAGRHGPVVLHGRPHVAGARTVESVPAATLALLLELGIVPAELDVLGLRRERWVAWEGATPERRDGPACAHLDRSALLGALWRRVAEHPAVELAAGRDGQHDVEREPVVDATGRRACTAVEVRRPPSSWVASVAYRPRDDADPALRLAAAADGYVYRLGSARWLTVGWVGPGTPPRDATALWRRIGGSGAGWVLADLPGPSSEATWRCPAGAALPIAGAGVLPIGDAALTRDALASQGTSIGLSDACQAADRRSTPADLAAHRADARRRHLRQLGEMLRACRFADMPVWSTYHRWVAEMGAIESVGRENRAQLG
jgi:2-polyprenyl-6-methoxyphenol hydroxylase-like FAD-dependent oxidoreductase